MFSTLLKSTSQQRGLAGALLSGALVLAVSGCSTIEIKDIDRTQDNRYKGSWTGNVNSAKSLQLSDPSKGYSRTLSCSEMRFTINADVSNGLMTAEVDLKPAITFSANINEAGRFYAELPRESAYLFGGRSRFGAHEFHVFEGNLSPEDNKGEGFYIAAIGSMAAGGCRYPIKFTQSE